MLFEALASVGSETDKNLLFDAPPIYRRCAASDQWRKVYITGKLRMESQKKTMIAPELVEATERKNLEYTAKLGTKWTCGWQKPR